MLSEAARLYLAAVCVALIVLVVALVAVRRLGSRKKLRGGFQPTSGSVSGFQKISDTVSIFRPEVECTPVTCMKALGGRCLAGGACAYPTGAQPFTAYPHAMATHYCGLEDGGCSGAIGDPRPTIARIRKGVLAGSSPDAPPGGPVTAATRFGVTANPPLMIGNSAEGVSLLTGKPVGSSYQGASAVSGVCYDIEGPGGRAILVAGDRCGGYCRTGCGAHGAGGEECGPCVSAVAGEPTPTPPCVGTVPGLYSACRGESAYGCAPPVLQDCDWCASQNHPHFDLDDATYDLVCGAAGGVGSCELTRVTPFRCAEPGTLPAGGSCPYASSYDNGGKACGQPAAQYVGTGGAACCCPWGEVPDAASQKCVPAHGPPPHACPFPGSFPGPCSQPAAAYRSADGATCCCPWGTTPDLAKRACVRGPPPPPPPPPPPTTPCDFPGSYGNADSPCGNQPASAYRAADGTVCCCPAGKRPDPQSRTCV